MARLGHIAFGDAWRVGHELGWPDDVIYHVLVEHGHRQHIRDALEQVDLKRLAWTLECLTAAELVLATHHPQKTWVESVAEDPEGVIKQKLEGDKPFDMWPGGTWARPPFFIDAALLEPPSEGLYLVEGHTRLGLLTGFVRRGGISEDSQHCCWVARLEDPPE